MVNPLHIPFCREAHLGHKRTHESFKFGRYNVLLFPYGFYTSVWHGICTFSLRKFWSVFSQNYKGLILEKRASFRASDKKGVLRIILNSFIYQ